MDSLQKGHAGDMSLDVFKELLGDRIEKHLVNVGEDYCTWASIDDPFSEVKRSFIDGYTYVVEAELFQLLHMQGRLRSKKEFNKSKGEG